jgi:hypothetical protein
MESPHLPSNIPAEERTPLVNLLLNIIAEQQQVIEQQQKTIERLEAKVEVLESQVNVLEQELKKAKKLPKKPQLKPSNLESKGGGEKDTEKGTGRGKGSKKQRLQVAEERFIEPTEIPADVTFNGYRDYDVQELSIEGRLIRFKLAEYVDSTGKTIVGKLPDEYQGHYGPVLKAFILYQHHQCRVPQHLIHEQLCEWNIEISSAQVNRILQADTAGFTTEQDKVLRVGLETTSYVHTDDTSARHQGRNGYCTVLGNDLFAYFSSSDSKSRQNYLEILRHPFDDYVLNEYSRAYLEAHRLAQSQFQKLTFSEQVICHGEAAWQAYLASLNLTAAQGVRLVTEAALIGSVIAHGVSPELIILSDGAPQFVLFVHALCWIHMERSLRRLVGETPEQAQEITTLRYQVWAYYQALKIYRQFPSMADKQTFYRCFEAIFGQYFPGNEALNDVLKQFRVHQQELLRVLETPEVPLHTNDAESDIREIVIRRKISGSTRSESGRRLRDTFVGLKKTCRKLGVSFWQYLTARLKRDHTIPFLPDIIRQRVANVAVT